MAPSTRQSKNSKPSTPPATTSHACNEDSRGASHAKSSQSQPGNNTRNEAASENDEPSDSNTPDDNQDDSDSSSTDSNDPEPENAERSQFRGPHCIALITSIINRKPHTAAFKQRTATWEAVAAEVNKKFPKKNWAVSTLRRKAKALVELHQKGENANWAGSRIHINDSEMIQLAAILDKYCTELEGVEREANANAASKQQDIQRAIAQEEAVRTSAMSSLRQTRAAAKALPNVTFRSLPSSPSKPLVTPAAQPDTGPSTLSTASDFTKVIQYAQAGSQHELLESQHSIIKLQEDQLALDTARFEFDKTKHADEMWFKKRLIQLKQRDLKLKERQYQVRVRKARKSNMLRRFKKRQTSYYPSCFTLHFP
ncbi:hypothetical protein DL93DRAFT_2217729 [Clavulina sp. PMI_390]|nr:hypothetical protein DL93DRAFT_2217729 [Clavulina sp. PMI_390]